MDETLLIRLSLNLRAKQLNFLHHVIYDSDISGYNTIDALQKLVEKQKKEHHEAILKWEKELD